MKSLPEGNAIVYCQGAFNTTNGKTAHGLVRRTLRYRVLSVIDSRYDGEDAGEILDQKKSNIPIFAELQAALSAAKSQKTPATHFVVGLAPDGGRLSDAARADVKKAIKAGLHVDSGLHDFLSEDPEIQKLAEQHQVQIRDIRKPPPRSELHFFSGKIEKVTSLKIAVLGTDSAIGKRTTAWIIVDGLRQAGFTAEMVGTGQTGWMQGAKYSIILDSLINDFLSGEIEHAVWSAWHETKADAIVIEGQGSLLNPAYPGGYELLAAARPDVVVLQHAPARKEYDGFPGYPLHPLEHQIRAIELISGKPVIAVTINHENMSRKDVLRECRKIKEELRLPAVDVLKDGPHCVIEALVPYLVKGKVR